MPKNPGRFKGLLTNLDVKDVPPGYMVEQDNFGHYTPGRLDVRKGIKLLKDIWALTVSGTADFLSIFGYITSQARWVVGEKTDGTVKAVRDTTTVNSIVTGLNTFQPVCFTQDQYGRLIGVNGTDRGFIWDGIAATAIKLGIESPTEVNGPTNEAPIVTVIAAGTGLPMKYHFYYRYVDENGIPSSMSKLTELELNMRAGSGGIARYGRIDSGSGSIIPYPARVNRVELWRTLGNTPGILYRFYENAYLGFFENGAAAGVPDVDGTDEALLDNDADLVISLFDQDGFPEARRFERPPSHKPYVALLQDVMFYYGRVLYNEGTITATNGSPTITGAGTAFRSEMQRWRLRELNGATEYEVSSVNEGTQVITLTANFTGTTGGGKSYVLSPNSQEEAFTLYPSVAGEPESVNPVTAIKVQVSSKLTDFETGLLAFGSTLYVFHENSAYAMSFGRRPSVDAQWSTAINRGLVNNNCAIVVNEQCWCLDQLGIYRLRGVNTEEVSSPLIKDYFKNDIDFSASSRKWFSASYDRHERVIRWYVRKTGDTGTRPKRAICYNVDTGEMWRETLPMEIAGGTIIDVSGRQRLVLGGENDNFLLSGEGYADLAATAVTGTITTAATAATTFVDSAAAFTSALVGAPVTIVQGTGKGTERTISAYNSGTSLTVNSAWTTGLDSVYLIGAVKAILKTGGYEYTPVKTQSGDAASVEVPRQLRIQHVPTTNAALMTLRRYQDRQDTAETYDGGLTDQTGFQKAVPQTADLEIRMERNRGGTNTKDSGYTNIGLDKGVGDDSSTTRLEQYEIEMHQGLEQLSLTALDVIGLE